MDTPVCDEPQGYRVGTVGDDGSYEPRDRDDIQDEAWQRERAELVAKRELAMAEMEKQRQSRYTLRSLGFVFTDEGASAFEEMGGVVKYDNEPAPEHIFDPPPIGNDALDFVMRFIQ